MPSRDSLSQLTAFIANTASYFGANIILPRLDKCVKAQSCLMQDENEGGALAAMISFLKIPSQSLLVHHMLGL